MHFKAPPVHPLLVVPPEAVCEPGVSSPGLSDGDLESLPWGRPIRENCTPARNKRSAHPAADFAQVEGDLLLQTGKLFASP